MLADYKSAALEAFSDFYGYDLPIAIVQRALERTFISLAPQIARDLPHSVMRGGKGQRPASADSARWEEVEHDVYRHLMRSLGGPPHRRLPPMVSDDGEQEPVPARAQA